LRWQLLAQHTSRRTSTRAAQTPPATLLRFDVASLKERDPNVPLGLPPSLLTALKERFGLELRPESGPVEVLVIDHVEKPSPD
jgi:hypothetical protein